MEPCSKEKEIEKLLSCIYGNGDPGMKTDLALIKRRIHEIPTAAQLKVYAFFGGCFGVAVGLVGAIVLKGLGLERLMKIMGGSI